MLQWMGGSRKKIKQTRNSLHARQRKFFEQRRHQQRDEFAIQNANEGSRQRPESLDLLGLEKLCSVLAPLKVRRESPKAAGICKDTCKEEMKTLETNAASRAEAEWIPASPAAAVAGHNALIDQKNVKTSMEEQVASLPIQAPIQKRSPCKRGITLLDIVGDTEIAKNKSSSEAYAAFALEGTGILGKDTPTRRQTASVDMLSRFETHQHDLTTPKDGEIVFMDMNAVQGNSGGEIPWYAPAKEMEARCLRLSESSDANEWHERFSLPSKQRYSAERRNAGRLDMKPDKAERWDAFPAAAEDMFATIAIDGTQSTRSKRQSLKDEPDFMRLHSMLGIQGASSYASRQPAKVMEAPWPTASKSFEANIWNELLPVQQTATKNEGWLDEGAEHWIISPKASAENMLCFGLDEVQSTCSDDGQLQDEQGDLVFLPAKQSDAAATRNEGWLHDKEDHWNISPITFAENMLISSGVDEVESMCSKDGHLKDELGALISLPAKQEDAAATRNEGWLHDKEDRWNISPIGFAENMLISSGVDEQPMCSKDGQLKDELGELISLPVKQSDAAATRNEGWLHDKEDRWNISPIAFAENMLISSGDDEVQSMCSKHGQLKDEPGALISLPAKQKYAAATRNMDWPRDHWNISPITSAEMLQNFGVDEAQSTCSKGGHLKNEAGFLEMHTVLGVQELSCNARRHSAKFKEVAWDEDNVWDDLISAPAKPSAGTRNEGLWHGKRDEAVVLSSFPTTSADDVLTSFEKDEEQTTILEGRHLKDEPDMMEMNTFLGIEAELTWHHPAKEVPLQRASESYADVRRELFSVSAQQNCSAEIRMLNVKRDAAEHNASWKEQEQCGINNVRDDNPQIGSSIKMKGDTSPLFESSRAINQQQDRFSKEENMNADCESCSRKGEMRPNPKNRYIQSVLLKLRKPQDCKERKQYSSLQHSTCTWSWDVQRQIQQLPGTDKDVLSTASCSEQKLQMPETNEIGNPANSFVNHQFKLSSQKNSTGDQEPPFDWEPDNCDLGMVDEDNDSGHAIERSPAVVKKPPENIISLLTEHAGQESPSDEIYNASQVCPAHENPKYVRMLESYVLQLQCMNKALLLDP